MQIIYNKNDGLIMVVLEDWQNKDIYFTHYPKEFRDNLSVVHVENLPSNIEKYRIKNSELIELTERESLEIQKHGKILTDEERLLNKLKPNIEEIQKAEQTIEILTLIQEVI